MILENPLYGDRRTDPGDDRPLGSVSDFAVMGRAAVVEGRALLAHFHRRGLHTGVGGFSMGGNIAAFVGALDDMLGYGPLPHRDSSDRRFPLSRPTLPARSDKQSRRLRRPGR